MAGNPPPDEQPPDYYRLLGLKQLEGNREVISHAADQRMAHIRSFQSGKRADYSQRLLNELSRAVGCLLNPAEKVAYDRRIKKAAGPDPAPPLSSPLYDTPPDTVRPPDTPRPSRAAPAPKPLRQARPLPAPPTAEATEPVSAASPAKAIDPPPPDASPAPLPTEPRETQRRVERAVRPARPLPSTSKGSRWAMPDEELPPAPPETVPKRPANRPVAISSSPSTSPASPASHPVATAPVPVAKPIRVAESQSRRSHMKRRVQTWLVYGGFGIAGLIVIWFVLSAGDGGQTAGPGVAPGTVGAGISDEPVASTTTTVDQVAEPPGVTASAVDSGGSPAAEPVAATSIPFTPPTAPEGEFPMPAGNAATAAPSIPATTVLPESPEPEGADAVRLTGADGIEWKNTAELIRFDQPFTVEMWVRLLADRPMHKLLGNRAVLPPQPPATQPVAAGWEWWIEEVAESGWRLSVATQAGFYTEIPPTPEQWHHLAVCNDGEQLCLFVDGQLAGRRPTALLRDSWAASPLNLHIASQAGGRAQQGGLNGDLRWFRISSVCRYTTNFTPPHGIPGGRGRHRSGGLA